MNYDAPIWMLLSLVGCGAATALIVTGSPRAGSAVASVVAAIYLAKVSVLLLPTYSGVWECMATFPAQNDWHHEHVLAECAWGRALWCLEVLPFAVPPLLVSVWGARRARKTTPSRWPLVWPALGALPTLALIAAMIPAATGWSPHDPRWVMGYLREWREAGGSEKKGGGACDSFLGTEDRLHGLVSEAEIAQAHADCLRVCETFAAVQIPHHFNPGVLEEKCARIGVRAAPLFP